MPEAITCSECGGGYVMVSSCDPCPFCDRRKLEAENATLRQRMTNVLLHQKSTNRTLTAIEKHLAAYKGKL